MTRDAVRAGAAERVAPAVLGMVLFISSETMFFGGLFAAYFSLAGRADRWPPAGTPEIAIGLPAALTALLLASSVTAHRAARAARGRDPRGVRRWVAATTAMGVAFLAGQGWEYAHLQMGISDNSFATLFFTMTGFHGLHVAGGVAAFALVLGEAVRSSSARHGPVEATVYYWHFVDVVWLLLFTTLYVLR